MKKIMCLILVAVLSISSVFFIVEPVHATGETSIMYTTIEKIPTQVAGTKPKINISYQGMPLIEGYDFNVQYFSYYNVGRPWVLITGIGNFRGFVTVYYDSIPKATSIKQIKRGKKSFTVKWKKLSAFDVTGYQIQYSPNKKFKKAKKVNVKRNTIVAKKIGKLKAKKKYYVRVRTYKKWTGVTYYSKWTNIKTVRTK